ncbi:MEDS domain-containing protein [Couchioplanes caeruleus]|nr:MEDS domain-containing protein [Couchioplanes caeruleus]ROP27852.1 histidine kinase-like protein [Couchioplanes caeruleus]
MVNHRGLERFLHGVLVVDAEDTIERRLVPLLRREITAGQAVLMVVGSPTAQIVRDRLGRDADALRWAAMDGFYQRLGFTYSGFDRYLREQHARREAVHVVAEPDVVSDPVAPVDRTAAYLKYEAMTNEAYAGYGCPITCIWHRRHHSASIIDDVRRVHPRELTGRGDRDNPAYVPPAAYLKARTQAPMTPAPPVTDVDLTVWDFAEVGACRAAVARFAAQRHFAPAAVRHVVAATSEVVANGLRHGRPPVQVFAWTQDDTLIVHVQDHGGKAVPSDAGYRQPAILTGPAGLWIARQVADVLLTRTAGGRTTVRMYFPYAVTHRSLPI